jgi:hypothetical protein
MKSILAKATLSWSPSRSCRRAQLIAFFHGSSKMRADDRILLPTEEFRELGVFRENEADDINVMVQNFTSPALARAIREKEITLQNAARLCHQGNFDDLKSLLVPYLPSSVERKRTRKHDINITEGSNGLSRKDIVILQRYLHRMPRHVSQPVGKQTPRFHLPAVID